MHLSICAFVRLFIHVIHHAERCARACVCVYCQYKNKRGELKSETFNRLDKHGQPNVTLLLERAGVPDDDTAACLDTEVEACIQQHVATFSDAAREAAADHIERWSEAARRELCFTMTNLLDVTEPEMRQWG